MNTADFDYDFPPEQIAATPADRRDQSRLCVLDRAAAECEEARFADLARWLRAGDLLVANSSRVFPARLVGRRHRTGGKVELLLVERASETDWRVLCRPARKIAPGQVMHFGDRLHAEALRHLGEGERLVRFTWEGDWADVIAEIGKTPLPPYILESRSHRADMPDDVETIDRERYQTVYAREEGSVAAPTAGLHFTEELIAALRAQGIEWAEVTLHVGPGTFQPVKVEDPADHRMHAEAFTLTDDTAARVNAARAEGRRVVAVGTTSVRVLEACADAEGRVAPHSAETDIFIRPGHAFRAVDAMITNFHLPRSTLLMLVCAFAGREHVLAAYQWAVDRGFRLYSYGDAMLIV